MSATNSTLLADVQVLKRKPVRRYVGAVLLACIAGLILWVYPVENLLLGDWSNWPNVAFLLVIVLPVIFLQVMHSLVIHILFENIMLSEEGVHRFGKGGKWKLVDGSKISSIKTTDEGLSIYVGGKCKHFFPATHYTIL